MRTMRRLMDAERLVAFPGDQPPAFLREARAVIPLELEPALSDGRRRPHRRWHRDARQHPPAPKVPISSLAARWTHRRHLPKKGGGA